MPKTRINSKLQLDNIDFRDYATITDPAVADLNTAMVDDNKGVVVTTTTAPAGAFTLGAPTDATEGKTFRIVNNDTSTDDLDVNGEAVEAGKWIELTWDGDAWIASAAGAAAVATGALGTYATIGIETSHLNWSGVGIYDHVDDPSGMLDLANRKIIFPAAGKYRIHWMQNFSVQQPQTNSGANQQNYITYFFYNDKVNTSNNQNWREQTTLNSGSPTSGAARGAIQLWGTIGFTQIVTVNNAGDEFSDVTSGASYTRRMFTMYVEKVA